MKWNRIAKNILCSISPKLATQVMYLYNFKKPLNLKEPQNINEKLQYLKLNAYYENPVITQCADKYSVGEYLDKKGYAYLLQKLRGGICARRIFEKIGQVFRINLLSSVIMGVVTIFL